MDVRRGDRWLRGVLPVGPGGPARLRSLPGSVRRRHQPRSPSGQTNATGVVSAVNFEYRGFDTLGEEFILFAAATGVSLVLRHLRGERERPAADDALDRDDTMIDRRDQGRRTDLRADRRLCIGLVPRLTRPDQPLRQASRAEPCSATAFIMIYLGGQFLTFKRVSPVDITDAVEAAASGAFAAVGVAAVALGLPYLANFLPLGGTPGAVELVWHHRTDQLLRGCRGGGGVAPRLSARCSSRRLLVPARGRR